MRILLVNDYGTPAGGAEVIVMGLRDALRARGHEVRVFASSAGHSEKDSFADERCVGTAGRWRTLLQTANPSAARGLRSMIARFEPDVVHVNLYLTQLSPLVLRALEGVASVYYAQWSRAICPRGTRRLPSGSTCESFPGRACLRQGCIPARDWPPMLVQMALDRAWGGRFTRVAAISHAVADRLARFGAPHLRSAAVVHPGTEVVEPREAMTPTPSVFAASRLVPEKGIDVLLAAMARVLPRHPRASLVVAGDGPERERLRGLTERWGLGRHVEFTGHIGRDEVFTRMRSSWVACVPSVWEEPFGMIAAEAQMHGVAVLASRAGGLTEIVTDGATGFLVPPGDVDATADRLDVLFSDGDKAREFGRQGHHHARQAFGLDSAAARFEALYREAIAAYRGRRR